MIIILVCSNEGSVRIVDDNVVYNIIGHDLGLIANQIYDIFFNKSIKNSIIYLNFRLIALVVN